MFSLYVPALVVAFVITVVELTEVAAIVFALGAERGSVRQGALGAIAGTAVVGGVALGFGAILVALPKGDLLWGASIVLLAFGIFLYRSTLRSYRRARAGASSSHAVSTPTHRALQFAGGFSVGAIEAIEAVIVLVALAAAGYGVEALTGAFAAGAALVAAALVVHERIRRIKVPTLKLGATGMLFAFSVFWGGEAAGIEWPGRELTLIPLFVTAVLVVRGSVEYLLPRPAEPLRVETKG